MLNKKSSSFMYGALIAGAIGLVVYLILSSIYGNFLGEGNDDTKDRILSAGDFDGDGTANYFDKCACIASDSDDGCPPGFEDQDVLEEERIRCKDEMDELKV